MEHFTLLDKLCDTTKISLLIEGVTKGLMGGSICSTDTLDKGMIRVPGRTELVSLRLHHATQSKTYELFTSGNSHLMVLE